MNRKVHLLALVALFVARCSEPGPGGWSHITSRQVSGLQEAERGCDGCRHKTAVGEAWTSMGEKLKDVSLDKQGVQLIEEAAIKNWCRLVSSRDQVKIILNNFAAHGSLVPGLPARYSKSRNRFYVSPRLRLGRGWSRRRRYRSAERPPALEPWGTNCGLPQGFTATTEQRCRMPGDRKIHSVTQNGVAWSNFDPAQEVIVIPPGQKGQLKLEVSY
jgi:hypothetical protein